MTSPLVPVPGTIAAKRRELTDAELAEVADAREQQGLATEPLGATYPASSIVVRRLCRLDFRRLLHDQLKDEEINAFGFLLMQMYPDVLFLSTHFYSKLMQDGVYDYSRVRRWKEHQQLFSKRLVLMPVHGSRHWTLLAARPVASSAALHRIEYYDSCGADGTAHLDSLRRFLKDAHHAIKKVALDTSSCSEVSFGMRSPQQGEDGVECGVFMLRTAEYLAGDLKLDFTLDSIRHYERARLTLELLRGELLSKCGDS
tara:strand:+ start:921 stop:1691 length:771 start_codon:yes stop_codon:yes gene_type:complete